MELVTVKELYRKTDSYLDKEAVSYTHLTLPTKA